MASEAADFLVRPYQPGDEGAILPSFNCVFAAIDPTFTPRSAEEWRWRYAENPAGLRIYVVLAPGGEVVAHQAGMPIAMVHKGERVHWNQVVDSFTDPAHERGLHRSGAFLRAAQEFNDVYGGPPPRDQIMYGLPVRRAFRIGQKLLKYQTVRNQNELRGELGRVALGAAGAIEVEEVAAFPEDVDAFFERARAPFGAVAARERAFLDWRFVRRPATRYRIALARLAGELVGYAVYRRAAFDLRESGLVCDWLIDPARRAAGNALRAWLVETARAEGAGELRTLLPETCADFREFQQVGWRVHPTSYFLAAGSYFSGFHTLDLYWDWYYTLAEFDLC